MGFHPKGRTGGDSGAGAAFPPTLKDGAVPVDAIARQVLKAPAGERVEVRPLRPAVVV